MAITFDQVRWVAQLARLDLAPDELESIARELGVVLDYINQLQAIDTDGVEPMAHALDLSSVFREDQLSPSLDVEVVLANAPARKGDFYAVPAVLD